MRESCLYIYFGLRNVLDLNASNLSIQTEAKINNQEGGGNIWISENGRLRYHYFLS